MKNYIYALIASVFLITSCTGPAETSSEPALDSTQVTLDTVFTVQPDTLVLATDTLVGV